MKSLFFDIINRFYFKNKFKFYFLIFTSFFAGVFEYLGLVLIFQFIMFLSNPSSIHCEKILYVFKNYIKISEFNKISLILGVFVAGIYISKNIYMLVFTKFNNKILEDLSVQITLKVFKNLLYSPYILTKKLTEADKLNIISKITLVVWQYCYKYINLIINIAIICILVFYLFIKFTKVASAAFLFLSVLALVEYLYLKSRSNTQNAKYTAVLENVNSLLLTVINSIKEIKINNKEKFFLSKSEKKYKELAALNRDRNFNNVIHIYFTEISVMLGFIVILTLLFYTTNFNNQILISSLCTICVLILRLTPCINRAQSALYSINSNKQAAIDLISFDEKFLYLKNYENSSEKLAFNESIELENVDFNYDTEAGIKNVNLKINKNDFVHIIGKSGSYKTTLALILAGLIKPSKGKLVVDKKEVSEFKKWQNNVSLLSQDFTFLYENISEILDLNNQRVAELAQKLDLKNIKNKKITEISSGEKQRIALIDILIKDKNVIILDEATANIDIASQNEIMKILENYKNKKTIIFITHRLENIKGEDKVIYMDGEHIIFDSFINIKQNEEFKLNFKNNL